MSKLPAPSVSMPCDYPILQSPTKEQVKLVLSETAQRSLLGYQIYKNEIAYKTLYPTNLHRSALPCES